MNDIGILGLIPGEAIALASLAVAVIALAVAIWQGYLQRRHYELSSMPCLEIYFGANSAIGLGLGKNGVRFTSECL